MNYPHMPMYNPAMLFYMNQYQPGAGMEQPVPRNDLNFAPWPANYNDCGIQNQVPRPWAPAYNGVFHAPRPVNHNARGIQNQVPRPWAHAYNGVFHAPQPVNHNDRVMPNQGPRPWARAYNGVNRAPQPANHDDRGIQKQVPQFGAGANNVVNSAPRPANHDDRNIQKQVPQFGAGAYNDVNRAPQQANHDDSNIQNQVPRLGARANNNVNSAPQPANHDDRGIQNKAPRTEARAYNQGVPRAAKGTAVRSKLPNFCIEVISKIPTVFPQLSAECKDWAVGRIDYILKKAEEKKLRRGTPITVSEIRPAFMVISEYRMLQNCHNCNYSYFQNVVIYISLCNACLSFYVVEMVFARLLNLQGDMRLKAAEFILEALKQGQIPGANVYTVANTRERILKTQIKVAKACLSQISTRKVDDGFVVQANCMQVGEDDRLRLVSTATHVVKTSADEPGPGYQINAAALAVDISPERRDCPSRVQMQMVALSTKAFKEKPVEENPAEEKPLDLRVKRSRSPTGEGPSDASLLPRGGIVKLRKRE